MDIANPVGREVTAVYFSFYSADEIRRLSVKQISNPVTYDTLGHPTKNGVYDAALGPFDKSARCETCSLNYFQCPGHFGHIELAFPVYKPVTFRVMYKLLQSLCFYCHHLRMPHVTAHHFASKLKLIHAGLLMEAIGLDDILSAKPSTTTTTKKDKKKPKGKSGEEDAEDGKGEGAFATRTPEESIALMDEYVEHAMRDIPVRGAVSKSTNATEVLRALERQFLASINPQRCPHCGGQSPKMYKEEMHKIFELPLPAKAKQNMEGKGLKIKRLFDPEDDEDDAKVAEAERRGEAVEDEIELVTAAEEMDVDAEARAMDVDDEEEEENGVSAGGKKDKPKASARGRYLPAVEVRAHMRRLWKQEREVLDLLYGHVPPGKSNKRVGSAEIFFTDVVAVTPTRFRPPNMEGEMVMDHPHNARLKTILENNELIVSLRKEQKATLASLKRAGADQKTLLTRNQEFLSRILNAMIRTQQVVNYIADSSRAPRTTKGMDPPSGIKQILEKKEGLFRMHMMGKRVNYAARSVISPDPYIETNEIGIPPVFAKKLTYPEPVTDHNYEILRQAVINGPHKWPGAISVQMEDGRMVNLDRLDEAGRTGIANQLRIQQTVSSSSNEAFKLPYTNKKVYRHLRNGDFLLLNRQPTLHKPSIMAHTARILPGEKTIRMHYANCNTYNADFDGDEMNVHFPQNELGRAEAMLIARTDQQYLVPTDGGVLRGLIQDHVCAGVLMCSRDTFFDKAEYMQLVYAALRPEVGGGMRGADNGQGGVDMKAQAAKGNGNVEAEVSIGQHGKIVTIEPALFKPTRRWTGKQVLSTVLLNLTYGKEPLNLSSNAKIPAKYWGTTGKEEGQVLFMDGELLTGILDKSQFGASAYGMVHAVYEVYGAPYAGKLLSMLGRLFTAYLQMVGFTCRMDDLRLTPSGDALRRDLIDKCSGMGTEVAKEYVGITATDETDGMGDRRLSARLEGVLRNGEKMAGLDSAMKGRTNKVTSSIIAGCIPEHLHRVFPFNNMQLMTVSGAKGSPVNVSQISCLLGQQELEGRRVPTMVSGKTLPSFRAFDTSARAGGYITGRFLTGIKPQEYYFHCMAGREGLIDTAVKTSRSGYLQRCLIKHLEGVKVAYDQTVRDVDGSVLQFRYGEDALDVIKQKTLTKLGFCASNYGALLKRYLPGEIAKNPHVDLDSAGKYRKRQLKKLKAEKEDGGDGVLVDEETGTRYLPMKKEVMPVLSEFDPARYLGSVSDKFADQLDKYIETNPDHFLVNKKGKKASEATHSSRFNLDGKKFRGLMELKYMKSTVEPGEAVGLLAAQSVGEPSTQMTLNTFHFAGFGAKNVTLGIPRLREIIMTASADIQTPMMRLPVKEGVSQAQGEVIAKQLSRLTMSEFMDCVVVKERLVRSAGDGRVKLITVRLNFWPRQAYRRVHSITPAMIGKLMEEKYIPALERKIRAELKMRKNQKDAAGEGGEDDGEKDDADRIGVGLGSFDESKSRKKKKGKDDEGDGGDEQDGDEDGDSGRGSKGKRKGRKAGGDEDVGNVELDDEDERESDEEEDEAERDASQANRAGRHAQKATYDEGDDDDEEIRERTTADDDDDAEPESPSVARKTKKLDRQSLVDDEAEEGESESDEEDEDKDGDVPISRVDDAAELKEAQAQAAEVDNSGRNRVERILHESDFVCAYRFDYNRGQWCEIDLQFQADSKKLLMVSLVEGVTKAVVVREIKGIKRAFIMPNETENDKSIYIGTEGINLRGLWNYEHVLDVMNMYTNDIAAMLHTYGVEAARATIVKEIASVFGVYGISVDPRHLSLIADYMTFEGGYKAFNRTSMRSNSSPFCQMSFETTTSFLVTAAISGDADLLQSPSARIVMGKVVGGGTGSFEVMQPIVAENHSLSIRG